MPRTARIDRRKLTKRDLAKKNHYSDEDEDYVDDDEDYTPNNSSALAQIIPKAVPPLKRRRKYKLLFAARFGHAEVFNNNNMEGNQNQSPTLGETDCSTSSTHSLNEGSVSLSISPTPEAHLPSTPPPPNHKRSRSQTEDNLTITEEEEGSSVSSTSPNKKRKSLFGRSLNSRSFNDYVYYDPSLYFNDIEDVPARVKRTYKKRRGQAEPSPQLDDAASSSLVASTNSGAEATTPNTLVATTVPTNPQGSPQPPTPKRKRGRPRKNPLPDANAVQPIIPEVHVDYSNEYEMYDPEAISYMERQVEESPAFDVAAKQRQCTEEQDKGQELTKPANNKLIIPDEVLEATIRAHMQKASKAKKLRRNIASIDMECVTVIQHFKTKRNEGTFKPISCLKGIHNCKKLQELHLKGNSITSLGPLENSLNISQLWLSFNLLTSLSGLTTKLVHLSVLDLSHNCIEDISDIKGLKALTYLNLSFNQIRDISPLIELELLEDVNLDSNKIRDISCLENSTKLQLRVLSANDNEIENLAPLRHVRSLSQLHLRYNCFTTISPLLHLPRLIEADLSLNSILTNVEEQQHKANSEALKQLAANGIKVKL